MYSHITLLSLLPCIYFIQFPTCNLPSCQVGLFITILHLFRKLKLKYAGLVWDTCKEEMFRPPRRSFTSLTSLTVKKSNSEFSKQCWNAAVTPSKSGWDKCFVKWSWIQSVMHRFVALKGKYILAFGISVIPYQVLSVIVPFPLFLLILTWFCFL